MSQNALCDFNFSFILYEAKIRISIREIMIVNHIEPLSSVEGNV